MGRTPRTPSLTPPEEVVAFREQHRSIMGICYMHFFFFTSVFARFTHAYAQLETRPDFSVSTDGEYPLNDCLQKDPEEVLHDARKGLRRQAKESSISSKDSRSDPFANGPLYDGNGSWEACGTCNTTALPSIEGYSERTIVCKGYPGKMVLQETLSTYVHVSPQQCESICECSSCITCGVPARKLPTSVTIDGKEHKVKTGNSKYLLLLVQLSGTEFVAKIGANRNGRGDAAYSSKVNSLRKIRNLCGFEDVVPEEHLGPLLAMQPSDSHANWQIAAENVLFSEYFVGVQASMDSHFVTHMKGINHSQVLLSTFHDFLVGRSCTPDNILLLPGGNLQLIDNQDKYCLGSIVRGTFIPGSPLWFKHRKENDYFDFRCHLPSGFVGNTYPPQLTSCLQFIASKKVKTLASRFQLANQESAFYLKERATNMLQSFEYALHFSLHKYTWKRSETFGFTSKDEQAHQKNFPLPPKTCI